MPFPHPTCWRGALHTPLRLRSSQRPGPQNRRLPVADSSLQSPGIDIGARGHALYLDQGLREGEQEGHLPGWRDCPLALPLAPILHVWPWDLHRTCTMLIMPHPDLPQWSPWPSAMVRSGGPRVCVHLDAPTVGLEAEGSRLCERKSSPSTSWGSFPWGSPASFHALAHELFPGGGGSSLGLGPLRLCRAPSCPSSWTQTLTLCGGSAFPLGAQRPHEVAGGQDRGRMGMRPLPTSVLVLPLCTTPAEWSWGNWVPAFQRGNSLTSQAGEGRWVCTPLPRRKPWWPLSALIGQAGGTAGEGHPESGGARDVGWDLCGESCHLKRRGAGRGLRLLLSAKRRREHLRGSVLVGLPEGLLVGVSWRGYLKWLPL